MEQISEGVWQGVALWDTNLPAIAKLASAFGQHTCMRLTLTLPIKVPFLYSPSISSSPFLGLKAKILAV